MSYEIPQQLEYKEKIIFGLTFKQLAYLFVFAPIVIILFFKTQLHLYVKIFISVNLSALAFGFMFLDLQTHLKNITTWFRNKRIEKPKQFAKFIPVKEIKDDLIILNDNKKIAMLKVEPINFSIKPENAKEAITAAFQKFLNSIDFPVQILMNTQSLNLNDYFSELEKKIEKNKDFSHLFTKYKEHLEKITSQKNVLNRDFYLVIPEKSDINVQTQICQSKLENIGLKSSRVKTEQLQLLIHNFFNYSEDKKPRKIENFSSFIKIDNQYIKTIHAHGYPRNVESGFLDKIVSSLGDFDLSLHIEPYDIETMMVSLNKELQKQRADLYAAKLKNSLNPSLEIKYEDTQNVLRNLQKGKEKLFNISLYINCRASSLQELELLTKRIQAELNALLIIPKQSTFRMAQGLQSCAPLAMNSLKISRNITTEALSAFFPFTSSFLQADKTGVWLGLNKNNIPIIKDIFKLSNPNGICLASSGSGKSYMAKLLISRYLLNGVKVIVIDPQGEYKNLVERFNGQRINLSSESETIINPLDLMGHNYQEKRLALMDLMPIMLGELTEPQKSFIDKAITEAYEKKGITKDSSTWNNEPPILEDLLEELVKKEKRASTLERTTIRSLINRLSMYVDGVFSFLNTQTKINFNNKFVCFDIGSMPKQVKPVVMFLVLDYVYMKMKKDIERKLLVIDEAWSLLGRTEDASYIFEIVKTCRKFNLALFLINQEVEGMLESEAGKSVLANSSYTLLMRQKPAVMKNIQETFFLSSSEKQHLLTAGVGEGILLMDDEHSEIRIVASEEEHKLITTNADELLEQNSNNEEQGESKIHSKKHKQDVSIEKVSQPLGEKKLSIRITVDENKPLYKHKDLKLEDIKYLIRKGFKETAQIGITSNKKEKYLIKPRFNESISHAFLCYEIADYLKKFTKDVQLLTTKEADIIFTLNNKRYAIEIETGKVLTKTKVKFNEKVRDLNKKYEKDWFFVVTNRNFFNAYKKYGETLTKLSVVRKIAQLSKL